LLVRRYLKSLRKIGEVLVASASSFAAIAALLLLFWVVFSIVGLHVFGGTPLDSDWPNFDTLVNSMVTIFNALNLENMQVRRAPGSCQSKLMLGLPGTKCAAPSLAGQSLAMHTLPECAACTGWPTCPGTCTPVL
jgi:hypothetical protein